MKQLIRLALVGAGATGRAHAAGAMAAGGFEIAAVVDPIADRLSAAAKQFEAVAAPSADAVLADPSIDAICLCVPTQLHTAMAIAAVYPKQCVLRYSRPVSNMMMRMRTIRPTMPDGK